MRKVVLAATQMTCSRDVESNVDKAERLIRQAAMKGANIILLQELFENIYFPQKVDYKYLKWAKPAEDHPLIERMSNLAKELEVVLPISFFEKCNEMYYNTVAVIDADGSVLGYYRKSHIPDDPGYYEKFYFSPGDTGFRVWNTRYARIGVGICWDQWFPEAARCMALQGAEVLLYPTAIGTDPVKREELPNQKVIAERWTNAMIGHSIANMVPVVASNRTGIEDMGETSIRFFGSSFITDETGVIMAQADQYGEVILTCEIDLDSPEKTKMMRFRDRRVDLYETLLTKDGKTKIQK
ncbi:carbon-nitrogen hydrolase [Gallibacter sp. Marseille-QA0791]|uniref:carbon-nitrogen hydrolase n=1 Tax=Gallibacter sp. Marseille-QA0791 TaxID=3378781 RepID=UPI003D098B38